MARTLFLALGALTTFVSVAAAADQGSVSWAEIELIPAAPESRAIGPDLLAAGPDGELAIWNPADALVHVYPGLDAAVGGDTPRSFALAAADDLAWTAPGLVVLDDGGRRLDLYTAKGQLQGGLALPGLVPTGCRLEVSDGVVWGVDVFSNRHPIARVTASGLSPAEGLTLQPPSVRVRWDASSRTLSAGNRTLALPQAIKAGGRVIEGGGARWLVVDAVVADRPITVERTVLSLDTGRSAVLPVTGRLYAPSQDLAVDGRGHLVWMAPMARGLVLGEVAP